MRCIYSVSDIHGRNDLLKEIIEENIDFTNFENYLVCCGDYIDGSDKTNSYECLKYLYELQKKHPKQITILRGNHEEWFLNWLHSGTLLEINQLPKLALVQDFIGNDKFQMIFIEARRKSTDKTSLARHIYNLCKKYILENHKELIDWLNGLPYYYEIDNQIFVHAGIVEVEEAPELWKIYSSIDDYLMSFPPQKTRFYKDIIAGHISTSKIAGEHGFHGICRYGSHLYLDSTVVISNTLNLLKYDKEKDTYTGIIKENDYWVEYRIDDRL